MPEWLLVSLRRARPTRSRSDFAASRAVHVLQRRAVQVRAACKAVPAHFGGNSSAAVSHRVLAMAPRRAQAVPAQRQRHPHSGRRRPVRKATWVDPPRAGPSPARRASDRAWRVGPAMGGPGPEPPVVHIAALHRSTAATCLPAPANAAAPRSTEAIPGDAPAHRHSRAVRFRRAPIPEWDSRRRTCRGR